MVTYLKKNIKSLRQYTYQVLESDHVRQSSGYIVDIFLVGLIIANVISVILESDADLFQLYYHQFIIFEVFSVSIFAVEYLLRLWCCPENPDNTFSDTRARLKWIRSPLAIIDLIAILPVIIQSFFFVDLRFLRLLRLLRILKLSRYSVSLRMLLKVLARESSSLQAMLFILIILIILASSGIYLVEQKAQPETFGSIPKSMWWAVVTLTTVGYGDVTPITPLGKIFGACITVLGIGIAALPAGILASGFANELSDRRKRLEHEFRKHLLASDIDLNHRRKVEEIRKNVGLSKDIANDVVVQLLSEESLLKQEAKLKRHHNHCPHCGAKIDVDI